HAGVRPGDEHAGTRRAHRDAAVDAGSAHRNARAINRGRPYHPISAAVIIGSIISTVIWIIIIPISVIKRIPRAGVGIEAAYVAVIERARRGVGMAVRPADVAVTAAVGERNGVVSLISPKLVGIPEITRIADEIEESAALAKQILIERRIFVVV